MKAVKVWVLCAFTYIPSLVIALSWRPTFLLAGLSLGTVGYVCGAAATATGPAAVPVCGLTIMASLLINIMGSFVFSNHQQSGTSMEMVPMGGSNVRKIRRQNASSNFPKIWHDLGNGTVLEYLDATKFEQGVHHNIWDENGNKFTGTRHASGKAQLTAHIPHDPLLKRREDCNDFAGVWDETVSTANDDFGQDDANAIAQGFSNTFSTGQGDHVCTTLTPSNGDAESVNIALTPMGTGGGPTTPYASCGA